MNFKINSRPLFTIVSKLKNDNFKTQDFSPLIERALAGVNNYNVITNPISFLYLLSYLFLGNRQARVEYVFNVHTSNYKLSAELQEHCNYSLMVPTSI